MKKQTINSISVSIVLAVCFILPLISQVRLTYKINRLEDAHIVEESFNWDTKKDEIKIEHKNEDELRKIIDLHEVTLDDGYGGNWFRFGHDDPEIVIPHKDTTIDNFLCEKNCDKYLDLEEALQLIIDKEGYKYIEASTQESPAKLVK